MPMTPTTWEQGKSQTHRCKRCSSCEWMGNDGKRKLCQFEEDPAAPDGWRDLCKYCVRNLKGRDIYLLVDPKLMRGEDPKIHHLSMSQWRLLRGHILLGDRVFISGSGDKVYEILGLKGTVGSGWGFDQFMKLFPDPVFLEWEGPEVQRWKDLPTEKEEIPKVILPEIATANSGEPALEGEDADEDAYDSALKMYATMHGMDGYGDMY